MADPNTKSGQMPSGRKNIADGLHQLTPVSRAQGVKLLSNTGSNASGKAVLVPFGKEISILEINGDDEESQILTFTAYRLLVRPELGGVQSRPRLHVQWGSGGSQSEAFIDLGQNCTFSLAGSGFRISAVNKEAQAGVGAGANLNIGVSAGYGNGNKQNQVTNTAYADAPIAAAGGQFPAVANVPIPNFAKTFTFRYLDEAAPIGPISVIFFDFLGIPNVSYTIPKAVGQQFGTLEIPADCDFWQVVNNDPAVAIPTGAKMIFNLDL